MTPDRPCTRCGRRITTGGNTPKVIICRDCKQGDPQYLVLIGVAS